MSRNTLQRNLCIVPMLVRFGGLGLLALIFVRSIPADEAEEHFEKNVRPLLIERCFECHAGESSEGGLKLDSRLRLLKGGDTGPVVTLEQPETSRLIQAVQYQGGLEMPPDGKLSQNEIDALKRWLREGAVWPGATDLPNGGAAAHEAIVAAVQPHEGPAAPALQLWLKADSLQLQEGDAVPIWPDSSGAGRDVAATRGIRPGGVGEAAVFVEHSELHGRPAVRFTRATGLASSPDRPVDIQGDAALTMTLVINLRQFEGQHTHTTVFCVGDPANAGDPGKPLAALLEIDQPQGFSLDFAGGWGHDAILGNGSFEPWFNKPVIVTIVKEPGPIRDSTRFYLNGKLAGPKENQRLEGRDTIPDIRHRSDIGIFLGKALGFCGAFEGDVGEVVLYNKALSDTDRLGLEMYLGEKYGLWIAPEQMFAARPVYSEAERNHWAYQPVRKNSLPSVQEESWVKTPVDRFALAAFETQGVQIPPDVDRRTWIRRVTLDLTGLPPEPQVIEEFLSDDSPQAFEKVVDRLLDSSHYGERWGRHWLDLVRYAETTANDANAVMRYAWRYRNYVIDAFNQDLPYDQFLIEQIAGDLLPDSESVELRTRRAIATGFLMLGPKALAETDKEQSRLDIVDDQIDVVGRSMLGLTIACARCHDHKFDAIRTTDYYAMAGVFRSTEPFQDENRNATMWWEFAIPQGDGAEPIMVMAPKETTPKNLRVHVRGNRFTLGKIVPRGVLGLLASDETGATIDPHQPSSGRLELAHWIADSSNPLTARVLVNRVWQMHFGKGIVGTPANFGQRGDRPAHPELLDWLAAEFVEGGWSVKQLHRNILLSHTYRLQNAMRLNQPYAPELESLLVRRRRLTAEELRDSILRVSGDLDHEPGGAESGEFLFSKAEDINAGIRPNRVGADDEFYTTFKKRSVYMPIVRNMLPDVLTLFDAADPNGVTAIRSETTVPSQSLFLLNHPFVRQQSMAFAKRLLSRQDLSPEQRVDWAHQLALGRPASPEERSESLTFITAFQQNSEAAAVAPDEVEPIAWQAFCQSLFCSNEFLYVE